MEKAQEEKRVSDEEYDDLAERVWNTHESNRASFSNVTRLPRVKSGEECMHSDKNHEDLQNSEDITSMEVPEIATLSDSDEATEYDPYDDSDTDESSEVQWTETSSSLSQECDQLMTELVEVIGKDNCQNDSFLDNEEPWKKVVNRFINVKTSEGFTFKTPAESANVCRQDLEEMEQCSQEDLFKELFQEYASDNDDALEEWVASDCETDGVQTSCEREPELNRENVSMDHDDDLLAEFYMWLVDVVEAIETKRLPSNTRIKCETLFKVDPHRSSHHGKAGETPFSTVAANSWKGRGHILEELAFICCKPLSARNCAIVSDESPAILQIPYSRAKRHCQCYPGDIKCTTRSDEFMVSGTEEKGCQEEARKA